jgi:hypothetical protein
MRWGNNGKMDMKDEVGITKDMLKAGLEAFYGYDSRFEGPRDVVEAIYMAMEGAKGEDRPTSEIQAEAPSARSNAM